MFSLIRKDEAVLLFMRFYGRIKDTSIIWMTGISLIFQTHI